MVTFLQFANVAMLSFGGGQLDEDTGLVHFLFRDYDPTTGFFIKQDPLGLRGGDVDEYGYCLDDPVNLVDPLGLASVPWFISQSAVREEIREATPSYGLTVKCTDEELDDLIKFVQDDEVDEFRKSYDKLPEVGKELTSLEEEDKRRESNKQFWMIKDIVERWGGTCIE